MSALTLATAMMLAGSCQHLVSPATIVGIAQHESSLDPTRIHLNTDGSRDYGLMQINDRNFGWLGLSAQAALDPCASIAAGAAVLANFSRYNSGSPTRSLPYALAVSARIDAVKGNPATSSANPSATQEEDDDIDDRPALLTERNN